MQIHISFIKESVNKLRMRLLPLPGDRNLAWGLLYMVSRPPIGIYGCNHKEKRGYYSVHKWQFTPTPFYSHVYI